MDTHEQQQLVASARAWIEQDPDAATRAALEEIIDRNDWAELVACMTRLEFGTAGLRAIEGPGPGRMNRAVVIRTTRGLADTLGQSQPDAGVLPVIVGYDARRNSAAYAEVAIRVLLGARFNVRFFDEPVPTPMVAYAAREYGAQAAICITASHNPREYAGFKVYGGNAVQIVAPFDARIAQAIERVEAANRVALGDMQDTTLSGGPSAERIDPLLIERYYSDLVALGPGPEDAPNLSIVYTPLHGVGGKFMNEALRRGGYRNVHNVETQFAPDPEFPTVAFPNPEEPGALDQALSLAERLEADLILANDPDADRLAVGVPREADGEGFRVLSGNQLGLLLADFVLAHQSAGPTPLVVSSVVSSPMIGSIASTHGARSIRTLTGFKWMLNAALAMEREGGVRFVFGFEEALGYCVAGPVRDKDGISAGLVFAHLVRQARSEGTTVVGRLAQLYRVHGLWTSHLENLNFGATLVGTGQAATKLRRLADEPPVALGGLSVRDVIDYRRGAETRPWYLGEAELLELELEGQARVLVRPSGTEPKIKIYADYRQDLLDRLDVAEQERTAEQKAVEIARAMAEHLKRL